MSCLRVAAGPQTIDNITAATLCWARREGLDGWVVILRWWHWWHWGVKIGGELGGED
ncbi:hypothetical protein B0T26DRAFT_724827 [Lasiosphaeria miniovina]|uniref:Uncharacterized protein n=1 Tax=Lasiosphaeria miniovina TaxID=1954250 RepID=A0AA39ZYC1_9PEZI|nr:uncharacterized protein B0T26DRAFT_724827 [Lasiosphaeria miniovina]KAK0705886.1 hypothetical protein B0T26DRAFT_724827 [Lasiosphaeria miniovina]